MRKHTYLIIASILAFLIVFPIAVTAEDSNTSTSESDEILQTTNTESNTSRSTIESSRTDSSKTTSSSTVRSELEQIRKLTSLERQQKAMELKNKATQERCTVLTANIDRRITYYDENYEAQLNRFQSLRTRVNSGLERLEDLGVDVTQLRAAYETLGTMLGELNQIRNDLIAKLEESKDYACGQSEGSFKTKIQEAEELVTQLRGKSREIKTFAQNDLKQALQAIKEQQSSTTSSSTSSAN